MADENQTVRSARRRLRKYLDRGTRCPVCDRHAQRYRRRIHRGMAQALLALFLADPLRGFVDKRAVLEGVGAGARDEALLRFWGLLEPDPGRPGWWRVTGLGADFLRGNRKVREFAVIYAGECEGLEGPLVSFEECWGRPFDLEELLDAR